MLSFALISQCTIGAFIISLICYSSFSTYSKTQYFTAGKREWLEQLIPDSMLLISWWGVIAKS